MKKILIIDNGGTVSMKRIKGTLKPVNSEEDIKRSIFELRKSLTLSYERVNQIDSTNLSPPLMKKVYDAVMENYSSFDGFVVLTGTDTLAYLSSFLSFWLQGIQKPVVVTGAQKPLNMMGSDAPANIYYSILFACEKIPEVTVFFGKHLFRGNRVTKVDAQGFDAFDSPNYLPLGHVDALRLKIHGPLESLLQKPQREKFKYGWSPTVHVITLYPGLNPNILWHLPSMGYKGLIIEAFGMGNIPNSGKYSLVPVIEKIIKEGVLVGVISKCLKGSAQVEYETAKSFQDLNVIFLGDITVEAAYSKMSYLLDIYKDTEQVKKYMKTPLAGEMSIEKPPYK